MRNIKFMDELKKEGVILVDKPSGVSSHQVVNWMRRLTGVRRIGHTGTLDPLATGLLVLLVGRKFTKMQDLFLKQDKEYICKAQLGIVTDSYDITGKLLSSDNWSNIARITQTELLKSLSLFVGEIKQTVPIFSAVKVKGRKLYDLARKNEHHLIKTLPVRTINIHLLELTDFSINKKTQKLEFELRISCSSGTYIRSLIHDIGQTLKVGAVVSSLRRTKIGKLTIDQSFCCPLFKF